jgi:hypothetical protein
MKKDFYQSSFSDVIVFVPDGKLTNLITDDELRRINKGKMPFRSQILAIKRAVKVTDPVPPYSWYQVTGTGYTTKIHHECDSCEGHEEAHLFDRFVRAYSEANALDVARAATGWEYYHDDAMPQVVYLKPVEEYHKLGLKPV